MKRVGRQAGVIGHGETFFLSAFSFSLFSFSLSFFSFSLFSFSLFSFSLFSFSFLSLSFSFFAAFSLSLSLSLSFSFSLTRSFSLSFSFFSLSCPCAPSGRCYGVPLPCWHRCCLPCDPSTGGRGSTMPLSPTDRYSPICSAFQVSALHFLYSTTVLESHARIFGAVHGKSLQCSNPPSPPPPLPGPPGLSMATATPH